jgi:hypothetical protein
LEKLRVFDQGLMDNLTAKFLLSRSNGTLEAISMFINACNYFGYKNDRLIELVETVLRSGKISGNNNRIELVYFLSRNNVYSPLFQDQLRLIMEQCLEDVSSVTEDEWKRLYEINLSLLVESPPKIKIKYMNDKSFKSFIDDNCSYSWYVSQEKARNRWIHSNERADIQSVMESLGWVMRVPELGKEVYHIDFASNNDSGDQRVAIVMIPIRDELRKLGNESTHSAAVRIITGASSSKVRHLQMFGYKVVPIWESELSNASSVQEKKDILLKASSNLVFATGVSR